MDKMVKITREFILRGATTETGGWSKRQFEILGESWPPDRDWIKRCCGQLLDQDLADEFLSLKDGAKYAGYRIGFGKYKGRQLKDIPSDYLEWVFGNCHHISKTLRQEIIKSLGWQTPAPAAPAKPPPLLMPLPKHPSVELVGRQYVVFDGDPNEVPFDGPYVEPPAA